MTTDPSHDTVSFEKKVEATRKGENLILKLGIQTFSLQSSELPQPAPENGENA
jgi:hypothetical protein